MSSEVLEKANEYIAELQAKTKAYKRFNKEKIQPYFRKNERDRKPPGEFVDSSFLYIRSYDGDTGVRPMSVTPFWHSPDMNVAPVTDLSAYTQLLDGGKTYHFACTLRNRGDLIVPSANVEFFLCEPTLGFDTRFATKIGVTSGWVNPYTSTKVGVNYTVPSHFGGHKCLFARVFSFSPVDLPIDDFQLSPQLDRHVGQLNLNFVAQANAFMFNLVRLPNAMDRIDLVPMTTNEMFALRHPFLADFKPVEVEAGRILKKLQVNLRQTDDSKTQVRLLKRGSTVFLYSQNEKGISFEGQKRIWANLMRALKMKNSPNVPSGKLKEIFKAYREMNRQSEQTGFELRLPKLGLSRGEATALKISAVSRVTGEMKGGITLIITG
jgi:hypothetical protein